MLIINSILGNVYKDSQLAKKIEEEKQRGKFRHLELSRTEMEKSRLRKKTADGLDVGFILEPGTKLNHGDVISKSDEIILIEQLPEKTLTVKFMENDKNLFLLVGHIIGKQAQTNFNKKMKTISFPIHDDSEMELFERLFHQVIDKIDLSIDEQRFIPRVGMDVHEH